MTVVNIWDGIEDAEIFERGKFFKGGFFGTVEVTKTLLKETRKVGAAFIVELEVIETNMPQDHPVGSKGTWFQKLTDKDVAFGAIAQWAGACVGYTTKQDIKEYVLPQLRALMSEATDNPDNNDFIGIQLRLETSMVKTQKGLDFTRYEFAPLGQ